MNNTMTAAVLYGAGDVRIETCPTPLPAPDEVVVQIDRALTCGTDVKVFRRGYHARMITPPALFGHEFAGVVQSVGNEVKDFTSGDRVVAANSAPCNACYYCARDLSELCEDLLFMNGAYAQFIKVPGRIVRQNLMRVPEHMSLRDAALVEPLACVVKGIEDTSIASNDTVVIIGAGPIGLMFVALTKRIGSRIICVGRREDRLRIAKQLGADEIVDAASVGDIVETVLGLTDCRRGSDRVIEAVGQPVTWEAAINIVRPGGTVNLFGGCPADTKVSLDTKKMHYSELTLKGSFHHTPRHTRQALESLANGHIRTDLLITGEIGLAALPELLGGGLQRNGNVKVAIDPWR